MKSGRIINNNTVIFLYGSMALLSYIFTTLLSMYYNSNIFSFKRKIRTRLDPLSIPQSGGKNVKTFRWDQYLQFCYASWLCMVINVLSVQYNGGLLPDIILLTQGYDHRGTRSNTMYSNRGFVFTA